MKLLYIGANWPQPWVTAAGLRTFDIIKSLIKIGYQVEFFTIKKPNVQQIKGIKTLDIRFGYLQANNDRHFQYIAKNPDVCIFDTARIEEMFGHKVYEYFPNCKRIIDTQDLHSLRLQRKKAVEEGKSMEEVVKLQLDWKDEMTCREFASILRSHSVITSSTYEIDLISKVFPHVNSVWLPFFYDDEMIAKNRVDYTSNNERQHFVWIGNFMHEPNVDALEFMVKNIWPKIHAELGCEFHIYGANCPKEDKFSAPGVVVKKTMGSIKTLGKYRCLLSYLRFGAGIKGKITDSFFYGLPVLTTSIGAESISPFPGFVEDNPEKFSNLAIKLYNSPDLYSYQQQAFDLISAKFSKSANEGSLEKHLKLSTSHPIQNILFSETIRSSVYFAKYIEMKTNKELMNTV